ncbi:MAG: hypothetical protein AAB457_00210 [Patescibacteria group bacterium]
MLSKTENKRIVEIPIIARIRPIAIEPQTAFVAFQFEDVRVAVPVSFVWRAIRIPLLVYYETRAVFYV